MKTLINGQAISDNPPFTPKASRVLLVVGFLWGDEGILRGLVTLTKKLKQQGWEVAIASSMEDREDLERFTRGPRWLQSQGIQHFYVPFPNWRISGKGKFLRAFQALLTFSAVVREFKPDLINIHSLSLTPYAKLMKLSYNVPYVATARIEPASNRLGVKIGAFINQYLQTFFGSRFIAISSEVKEAYATTLKIPRENIRLICHGIESDYFRPPSLPERLEARNTFNLASEAKVVSLIGRLHPVKGHSVLVRALAILRSQGMDVIALCAGAGDHQEESSIAQQAIELGVLDLVKLLGFSEPRQVLWASDVLALPSHLEGFPWVIPEAMLCGVVSVRTPTAGTRDQIEDGVNGFVVPFDDAEALAWRLKQLLENETLRTQMATAALESARQKFTVEKMVADTISVFQEVI
ncbi:MAG: glycosyltransferase family 4 protein [Cyanobacteriota bacterium]